MSSFTVVSGCYVTPGSPQHDQVNRAVGNAVLPGDAAKRYSAFGVLSPDRNDIRFRELRVPVRFSPGQELRMNSRACFSAPFGATIRHIVFLRTQEEMARIDAGWIIATVTHEQAVRYGSEMHLPRHAVSALVNPVYSQFAVAVCLRSNPNPTSAGLINPCPESLLERQYHRAFPELEWTLWRAADRIEAGTGAETASTPAQVALGNAEIRRAPFAFCGHARRSGRAILGVRHSSILRSCRHKRGC